MRMFNSQKRKCRQNSKVIFKDLKGYLPRKDVTYSVLTAEGRAGTKGYKEVELSNRCEKFPVFPWNNYDS